MTNSKEPTQGAAQAWESLAGAGVSMWFALEHAGGYLRADLYGRETAEDTRRFLEAVTAEAQKSGVDRVLISTHSSRPIYRVQQYGLAEFLETVASRPAHRIATVADSFEGQLAQQYVVRIARARGLNVRSFGSEEAAAAWLRREQTFTR
ncbi:MAG TPA: hypothetical protein VH600_02590 [Burkholderiales bacterium]